MDALKREKDAEIIEVLIEEEEKGRLSSAIGFEIEREEEDYDEDED